MQAPLIPIFQVSSIVDSPAARSAERKLLAADAAGNGDGMVQSAELNCADLDQDEFEAVSRAINSYAWSRVQQKLGPLFELRD